MKRLAEFVMRDRFRALLVVFAGTASVLLCWLSAAVLALVTLRKGAAAGAWLMFWALLPAGAILLISQPGDPGPLSLLLGTLALALILRETVSLPLTVLASAALGLLIGGALLLFSGDLLQEMVAAFGQFIAGLEQQLVTPEGAEPVRLARPTTTQVAGMMGTGTAMLSVLCLMLGRYWQAALYNPGGFGDEFRALGLSPAVATGLALGAVAVMAAGVEYRSWAMSLLLPLTFCGLAVVHARARLGRHGGALLAGFYLAWVVVDLVKIMVVLLALADSYLGFRRRWSGAGEDGSDPGDRD